MRYLIFLVLFGGLFSGASAQDRQEVFKEFKDSRREAKILEQKFLSPDKRDSETAVRENAGVFRILPRETYDNKRLFSTLGSGGYYSFYFRMHEGGYGSDLILHFNNFETGVYGCGWMADLGKIALNEITKEISSVNSLVNYENARDLNSCRKDRHSFAKEGLKLNGTIFKGQLPVVIGHSYIVRSGVFGYYDVLTAFQVHRKDADGSLIIFWKQLEQFETPRRNDSQKNQPSDAEILLKTKNWARLEGFANLQTEVNDGIVVLRGTASESVLANAVQYANDAGATKVINLVTIE